MERLNVKAMTALERSTLPKFIKAEAAIKDLPMDETTKAEWLTKLAEEYKNAQVTILNSAWLEDKPKKKAAVKVLKTPGELAGKEVKVTGKGTATQVKKGTSLMDKALNGNLEGAEMVSPVVEENEGL